MKKGVIILSFLIILSGLGLFLNYANYENTKGKVKNNEELINSINTDIEQIDLDINNTNEEYNNLKENNKEKIEDLEKWQKRSKEVEDLL